MSLTSDMEQLSAAELVAEYDRLLSMCTGAGGEVQGLLDIQDAQPTEEDLNRTAADKELLDEVNTKLDESQNNVSQIVAQAAAYQESQRIRRDTRIARSSHKELMLEYIKMIYSMKLQLEMERAGADQDTGPAGEEEV